MGDEITLILIGTLINRIILTIDIHYPACTDRTLAPRHLLRTFGRTLGIAQENGNSHA